MNRIFLKRPYVSCSKNIDETPRKFIPDAKVPSLTDILTASQIRELDPYSDFHRTAAEVFKVHTTTITEEKIHNLKWKHDETHYTVTNIIINPIRRDDPINLQFPPRDSNHTTKVDPTPFPTFQ